MNPFILTLKTHGINVRIHQHSAYQVVLSLNDPFTSVIDGVSHSGLVGFVIKPQVPHCCTVTPDTTVCVINIEPYSRPGLQLRSLFGAKQHTIVFTKPNHLEEQFPVLIQRPPVDWPMGIATALTNGPATSPTDGRVQQLIRYIETNYTAHTLTPSLLAESVFLSPSRMASLFKVETGSSVSKYLLWTRLRQAIILALTEPAKHLTEIAYETGFYDQAQLTKYMNAMTGAPPRALRQNSDLIQVL